MALNNYHLSRVEFCLKKTVQPCLYLSILSSLNEDMSITKENPVRSAGDYPCELTKALENEGESTKNAGVREPLSLISSSNVNVGYSAQTIAEQKVVKTESTSRETVYGTCTTPKTPRRTAEVNPGVCLCLCLQLSYQSLHVHIQF